MNPFKNKRKIVLAVVSLLTIGFLILWLSGVIPAGIARVSAERYVAAKYGDLHLHFSEVFWIDAIDAYLVSFKNDAGKIYNFKMSEHIPTMVMYDPLDPPG